ncbi:MAG TPA: hypothetical protein VJ650_04365 [Gemmatimonadaceae bacterium]|nr:hypothetical protein [Gemmatimonadaceae bacterium]
MLGHGRLIALASALACFASACQREAGSDASTQRAGDTSRGSVADACAPNGRIPAVTSGGIGVARIGAPIREVGQSCTARDTTFTLGEGIEEQGAVIDFAGHRVLALVADGAISRLIVADSTFRTERGLGVGNTVAELRQAYGRLCGAVGEGTVAVWLAGLPNVSFGLDTRLSDLGSASTRIGDDPSIIPDSARVTSLWVIPEGVACGGS